MQTTKLKDLRLSENLADAASLMQQLNALDSRLDDMQVRSNMSMDDIVDCLIEIIQHFGGNASDASQYMFQVTDDDIMDGFNLLMLWQFMNPNNETYNLKVEKI